MVGHDPFKSYLEDDAPDWKDNLVFTNDSIVLGHDQRIARITSFERLLQTLGNSESWFAHPSHWDDPYDSAFMKVPLKMDNGAFLRHGYGNDYYCQCWCKKSGESDAMWRIYSPKLVIGGVEDYHGIMIISDIESVMNSIWDTRDELLQINRYYGPIQYVPHDSLLDQDFFGKMIGDAAEVWNTSGLGVVRSMLYKSDAYSHEHEVRFVARDALVGPDVPSRKGITVKHLPDFSSIVKELVLDPRCSKDFEAKAISTLRPYFPPNVAIRKSQLYQLLPRHYRIRGT